MNNNYTNNMNNEYINNMNNEYINTRKKRVRYHFVTPTIVEENKDAKKPIIFFYQICTFKNPDNGMYHLRRFTINSKNEFMDIKNYILTKKQRKKFLRETKCHKYKCYDTYTLENINYPSLADIMTSQSDILSMRYNYSGFAPFHKY